jgi:hypothetical protein
MWSLLSRPVMERTWKDVTSILKLSELKWMSHFLVLKKAHQEEMWNWRQVNIVESALFEGHENMCCSITVSVDFLYLLLIMCIYLDFIWACCFQLAIDCALFLGFHGDTKMHCLISDWCNGVISSDSVTLSLI